MVCKYIDTNLDLVWQLKKYQLDGYKFKTKNRDLVDIDGVNYSDIKTAYIVEVGDKEIMFATEDYVARNGIIAKHISYKDDIVGMVVKHDRYNSYYVVVDFCDDFGFVKVIEVDYCNVSQTNIKNILPTNYRAIDLSVKKGVVIERSDGRLAFVMENQDGMFINTEYISYSNYENISRERKEASFAVPSYMSYSAMEKTELNVSVGDFIKVDGSKGVFEICDVYDNFVIVEDLLNKRYAYAVPNKSVGCVVDKVSVYRPREADGCLAIANEDFANKMVGNMIEVLESHGYDTRKSAVRSIYDEWEKQKSYLIELFRKSPNWDEENLCIKIEREEKHTPHADGMQNALFDIRRKIGANIDGKKSELDLFWQIIYLFTAWNYGKYTISKETADRFAKDFDSIKTRVNVGAKITRVIRGIIEELGLNDYPDFEKHYAKFSDAFSTADKKVIYTISVNPLDYLLMSNGNSWASCHYIDANDCDRCYQSGTLSYMLDNCSFVFSTILKSDARPILAKSKKYKRQMFMHSDIAVLQSRLYPNYKDTDYSQKVWEIVKNELDACNGTEIFYNVLGYNDVSDYFVGAPDSTHYEDYTYSEYNISLRRIDKDDDAIVEPTPIGSTPMCVHCGGDHTEEDTLYCGGCRDDYYNEDDDYCEDEEW